MKVLLVCFYQESLRVLRQKVVRLHLTKNLRNPGDIAQKLAGLCWPEKNGFHLYIDSELCCHERIKTLLHELAHYIFYAASEKQVCEIEKLLYQKLNNRQKRKLAQYLPKTISRKRPR